MNMCTCAKQICTACEARQRSVLRIILNENQRNVSNRDLAKQDEETTVDDSSLDDDEKTIFRILLAFFHRRRPNFPLIVLVDAFLRAGADGQNNSDPRDSMRRLIHDWMSEYRDEELALLAAAVLAIYLRGFNEALTAWMGRFRFRQCSSAQPTDDMRAAAQKRAEELISNLEFGLADRVLEIVEETQSEQDSKEEAKKRLERYVESPAILEDVLEPKASTYANTALNDGAFDANSAVGATKKRWIALPGACPLCLELSALDEIDIDEYFANGFLGPPAHLYCRCSLEYSGTTREKFAAALEMFNIVCRSG